MYFFKNIEIIIKIILSRNIPQKIQLPNYPDEYYKICIGIFFILKFNVLICSFFTDSWF